MKAAQPRYVIQVWPHGWLLCGPKGTQSIPMDALSQATPLFPKKAIMDMGIPHHYQASGNRDVVMCIATQIGATLWRAEIEKEIADLPPQERWWKGLDVGRSSAAIFSVLSPLFYAAAHDMSQGATPTDADDFGRCMRLLALFPTWREKLDRVAAAWPKTKWPALVPRWDEIAAATPERQREILSTL